jgi:hypothetical protein
LDFFQKELQRLLAHKIEPQCLLANQKVGFTKRIFLFVVNSSKLTEVVFVGSSKGTLTFVVSMKGTLLLLLAHKKNCSLYRKELWYLLFQKKL